ncbi:hypothetical protein P154DRAFT_440711 [Amniculicola lignicola CBS 123094]|uniref:Xylanolytic transcriptional activator regulatory domain-containing protein n=1 Tax=Amniculicola lignicola CBS 123094 TaxID=1392246 RepID=A0A6A5WBS3_9PLEO|nr:hypothetical protein P154DRAFT_440711 [Amniculicola lignicola CBS 123094]
MRVPDVSADHSAIPNPTDPQPCESLSDATPPDSGSELAQDFGTPAELPPHDILLELVNIFFDRYYAQYPCFHKASILDEIKSRQLYTTSRSLLYALCTSASQHHHDPAIRAKQAAFYEQSKFEYDITLKNPRTGIRVVQTALILILHAGSVGDFSAGWFYLGKAWRQVCALGINRMDCEDDAYSQFYQPSYCQPLPGAELEKEEWRRSFWLLLMMDRGHSWPTGWPSAIDDRQININLPISDVEFQNMTMQTRARTRRAISFTRDLNALVKSLVSPEDPLNTFQYLAVAYCLLGRAAEMIHSPQMPPSSPESMKERDDIDQCLIRFRLSLPQNVTSLLESPSELRFHVVWLNCILNATTILLHYQDAKGTSSNSLGSTVILAAENNVQLIKDASRISIGLLLSAHIGLSLYISACSFIIEWKLSGNDRYKADIDLYLLVFDRFYEVSQFMGLKCKLALEHDMARDMESIMELRDRGFRGLLADCSKWSHIREGLAKTGLMIT